MPWRNSPELLIICVFLAVNICSYSQATLNMKSDSLACDTFPPPRNLDWMTFDNVIMLIWEIPLLDTNLTAVPDNLIAYKIVKDGEAFDTVLNTGEFTIYFYDNLGIGYPSSHEYYVCALYELDSCGLPGQTGESDCEGPVIGYGFGGFILSFFEDWSAGSFDPNLWDHDEYWHVSGQYGHPEPCAVYTNYLDSAYRQELISYWLDCKEHPGTIDPYIDGDIMLDYEIKLNHLPMGATDYLNIELKDSSDWHVLKQFSTDTGSFPWTEQLLNITELAKGNYIRLGFIAHGDTGLNINDWYIDNISVYRQCNPPRDLHWVIYDEVMAWTPPLPHTPTKSYKGKGLQGYNIYVSFGSNYQYYSFTTDTFHIVDTVGWTAYYVTAIYEDCEPASDPIYGPQYIPEIPVENDISVFPNPCDYKLTIESPDIMESIQIFNASGVLVFHEAVSKIENTISTDSFPAGIYYLKIQTKHSIQVKKVIIHH